MPEPTTTLDYETAGITEHNLLRKLWLHPTATLRFILAYCPDKFVLLWLVLGGIARALSRAEAQSQGEKMSLISVLLLAVVGGGLFGWLTYLLYAWGLSLTGRWLGGRADYDTFRTVVAWSLVPSIAWLVLLLPQVAVFGEALFKSEVITDSLVSRTLLITSELAEAALTGWAVVILLKGTALVQGFKLGRALANILLPGLLVVGLILVVVLLFKLLEATPGGS